TRFSRDWSSDVCSPDLKTAADLRFLLSPIGAAYRRPGRGHRPSAGGTVSSAHRAAGVLIGRLPGRVRTPGRGRGRGPSGGGWPDRETGPWHGHRPSGPPLMLSMRHPAAWSWAWRSASQGATDAGVRRRAVWASTIWPAVQISRA